MKRDMDLAREILLTIENSENTRCNKHRESPLYKKLFYRYTVTKIDHHLDILADSSLIVLNEGGREETYPGSDMWVQTINGRLTWQGHEFLDAARDQNRWNQAKRTISEKGGSLTFDVLKAVLSQLARQAVGL